ncbi:MAG TPA: hypothetical protein VMD25_08015 [Acidobacteriaceae bacterium]|nr:hypothetical protein [Acidobacteriaceae bacterium]
MARTFVILKVRAVSVGPGFLGDVFDLPLTRDFLVVAIADLRDFDQQ